MYIVIDVVVYIDVVMFVVCKLVMGNVSMYVYAIMLKELLDIIVTCNLLYFLSYFKAQMLSLLNCLMNIPHLYR